MFFIPLRKTAGIDRGYDHLLQRDLSDAAYLSEMLDRFWSTKRELLFFLPHPCELQDLHALSMRVLALCLACTLRQHGRKALLWLYTAYFETKLRLRR